MKEVAGKKASKRSPYLEKGALLPGKKEKSRSRKVCSEKKTTRKGREIA